ncbi:3-hydroxyacyl-CoA dehydrogenase NAD-binding domain-containing protein [Stackebrandtia nassauensis]|uniref:3-hydroxyacyl-CoA dehydrogenase NAD-binding protein n=1 Tax=Stackebrandtia nassauensis (strain DSM 44728 / CIP 108903 / NRRL B-16338 / NBRC 102104 / LLR-40K-21) TaxID=446470 RepID=D3Q4N3_STANL|nr:3-hydroxyacyl-CoA dehydrogenase NAD-binding domain-containing protein [Stackebrandtia nassauensis]ADD42063.1 3-hydroxyacyl-CoA dehydrogenase NAD-binding protein [Stackebrandtia nassauensis DSM 44728]
MKAMKEFPDEVVTKSLVRYVRVPGMDGEAALITLDNGHDHKKPNSLGPAGLASLDAALDEVFARTPKVRFVAVTGKPFIFCVGADITGMPLIETKDDARTMARAGHDVFARLKNSEIPTFAFVNGAAMGGGVELSLHCHYRTISGSAAAFALPECFIGLAPTWGGTQLLPNLIGADGAVKVIIENALNQNKMLRPKEVHGLGIADTLLEAADFLEESLAWAAKVTDGQITVERPEIDRGEAWDAALARGKAVADMKLHGAAPAPYMALDLMAQAKTVSFEEGTAAEDEVLAALLVSPELKSSLYAFDLVQKRAKRPVGVPDKSLARPVGKVGVVGAGLMASQLALLFVRRLEVPVVMTDLDEERVAKGVGYVHAEVDKLLGKGRINSDKAAKLKALVSGSVDKSVFADADFVIEAVFEELGLKKRIFAELEDLVSDECVLATNTSSLSVSDMAADLRHPERVVGFHFFNPVAILPLLEVVRAKQTDDATVATAFKVCKELKKNGVLVADAPAFVVNRLLTRFLGEIFAAVDEGTDIEVADHAVDELGLPMSPFVLLQLVGPAVARHVAQTLHDAFPDRYGVSSNLDKLVEAGKTSVYTWDATGKPSVDPDIPSIMEFGDKPSTAEQIRDRALGALADEVRRMLDEGVVAAAEDIDLCMILGAGWPFHLGGITPYLDRAGVTAKVTGKTFH